MLEIIIYDTLVVTGDTNTPLLQFTQDSLATLFSDPRNIALSACVLEWEAVTVPNEDVSNSIKYWSRRASREYSLRMVAEIEVIARSKPSIITWDCGLGSGLTINLSDHIQDLFNTPHSNLRLSYVCSIKAIDAVGSKDALLLFFVLLVLKPFFDKKAKFGLNVSNFLHEIIDLVKLIPMSLAMKIIPNVLHISLRKHF